MKFRNCLFKKIKHTYISWCILAVLSLTLLSSVCSVSAEEQPKSCAFPEISQQIEQAQTITEEVENNKVYVGVWLSNIYSYEYKTGSYTLDIFLYFFWIDPNLVTIDWYLVNGYPVNPATTVLISSNLTGEIKYEIYRITAAFSSSPDASDFPFDSIELKVAVELLTHGYNFEMVWLDNETGIDPSFKNSGWVTTNVELTSSIHDYPLEAQLPRAEMLITQQRQRFVTSLEGLIPPIIFGIVSAFSFLFNLRDSGSVGVRLGLNTSMLVTTLLFTFTASNDIPPASKITIYSLFIMSILIFIVLNLLVTITGYVQWVHTENEKHVKRINRWGSILSIVIPIVFFILLYFVRS